MSQTSLPAHLIQGQRAENQALEYLQQQGLSLICRNFKCRFGELDLVMKEFKTLVIVEVRFRKNNTFGSAAESITPKKRVKIIRSTQVYLQQHPFEGAVRFDVVTLSPHEGLAWIKQAFQCP
jgi:putative endonuclease